MTAPAHVVLILFILVCAVASARVKELVSAAFILSGMSFFLALLWTSLGSPDVAFTEAMVGAGASTIFLFLTLFRSHHFCLEDKTPSNTKWIALIAVTALGALLLWGSLDLPALGDISTAANQYLSPYYLTHALEHSHTPNAVTAVVVDYRGFDTLIETTVIFTAGLACLFIMRTKI